MEFLNKSQYYSLEELETYQNEKLRDIILYAYNYVPHYKKIFDADFLLSVNNNQKLFQHQFSHMAREKYFVKMIKNNIN